MKKKNKLLTFVVPCYNSESYMERCLVTLLKGKEDVEIIIVNDGSTDKTAKIADGYQKRYPSIIKVIHKINGGHGSGVNAGLKEATGQYFKVVDSDDWLDEDALIKLLNQIKEFNKEKNEVDLIVCNYIYDHLYDGFAKVMNYKNMFEEEKIISWSEMKKLKPSQYLIMHALVYKTKILRDCRLKLPEHTFYVDNLVAYIPLVYVKKVYYMNIDLYHYFIGREDQSVNEKVMMGRIDQQIKVTKLIIDASNYEDIPIKLKNYMIKFLSMMMSICDVYLLMINNKESLDKRKNLWNYIKNKDVKLYNTLKRKTLSGLTYIPGKLGNFISISGYKIAKKIFKFN